MKQILIDGYDPLSFFENKNDSTGGHANLIYEAAIKGNVLNILKSYTGFFDILCELRILIKVAMISYGKVASDSHFKIAPHSRHKIAAHSHFKIATVSHAK
ncbi:MAG: hypothetical protein WA071_20855 [Undibacterium umbellatum]|uniref:hypothetical protein n=1 Tax=Undibacterium umbellatum TaxID=2762300 RepID=UPI003BB703D2